MKPRPPKSERLVRPKPEIDLQRLFETAGVSWEEFESDWNQAADVYRELIWGMASVFPEKESTEMTHVEFLVEPGEEKKIGLVLCLEFRDEKGGPLAFTSFMRYLKQHLSLIPIKLRNQFTLYVGFNYNDLGGFKLSGSVITPITQAEYDALTTVGSPKYYHDEPRLRLKESLHAQLRAVLEPTH